LFVCLPVPILLESELIAKANNHQAVGPTNRVQHLLPSHVSCLIPPGAVPSIMVCLPAAEALLQVAVGLLLVRVVLVLVTVVLVVELLGVAPGVTLGLLAVNVVGTLGLGETVDLTAGEASEELLGEAVRDSLAYGCVSLFMGRVRHDGAVSYPPSSACPRTSSWP